MNSTRKVKATKAINQEYHDPEKTAASEKGLIALLVFTIICCSAMFLSFQFSGF